MLSGAPVPGARRVRTREHHAADRTSLGPRRLRGDEPVHRNLRIRRQPGHRQPGRFADPPGRGRFRHGVPDDAPEFDAATAAAAVGACRGGLPGAVHGQSLREERLAADLREGRGRSRRLRAPREGASRLPQGGAARMVRRRLAGAVLPVAGRTPDHHRDAGRRPGGPEGRRPVAGRRRRARGRASFARAHAVRLDRPVGAQRTRPGRPRPGVRPLRARPGGAPALSRRLAGCLPVGAGATRAPHHRVGAGDAAHAAPSRHGGGRARFRHPSHDGRAAFPGRQHRAERSADRPLLPGRSRDRQHRAGRPGALLDLAVLALAMVDRPFARRRRELRGPAVPCRCWRSSTVPTTPCRSPTSR